MVSPQHLSLEEDHPQAVLRVGVGEPRSRILSDADLPPLRPAAMDQAAACAYMGLTAALVKMGQLEGWKIYPEPKV